MYEVVYQGVDTLDLAFKGALPKDVLDLLDNARSTAEALPNDNHGTAIQLGPDKRLFFVKAHGKKGGYRYTLVDDPTGAIYSIKADTQPFHWNFFVSARARGLLCRTYEGMTDHIYDALKAMGAELTEVSVNRIDYAVDIATGNFELEMKNFVAPRRSPVKCYFSTENELDDDGNLPPKPKTGDISAVMRGGRFESVTIGTMPNRQVILYDKLKAAKDLRTDYWFHVWNIDPRDPGIQIWRAEFRAGREALKRYIRDPLKRNYQTVEAILPRLLEDAADEIRYVTDRHDISNVTRSLVHPLWQTAQRALEVLPKRAEPALPPAFVLELMRREKRSTAEAQAFGNLNNLLMLDGHSPETILRGFHAFAAQKAQIYAKGIGNLAHEKKLNQIADRLSVYLNTPG